MPFHHPSVITGTFGSRIAENAALREYINAHIGRGPGQFRSMEALADAVHIPLSTFRLKMKAPAERFSYFQAAEIFRVTKATDREVAYVSGTKYRGRTAEQMEQEAV